MDLQELQGVRDASTIGRILLKKLVYHVLKRSSGTPYTLGEECQL